MRNLVPRWFAALAAVSLTVVSYGAWQSFNAPSEVKESAAETVQAAEETLDQKITLQDYFWLDNVPEDAYTPFNAYVFSDGMGVSVQFASSFKMLVELFEYRADNTAIKFNFMHDGRTAKSDYSITAYTNPKYPFLKAQLTLKNDPQAKGSTHVYYTGPDLYLKSQSGSASKEIGAAMASVRAQLAAQAR